MFITQIFRKIYTVGDFLGILPEPEMQIHEKYCKFEFIEDWIKLYSFQFSTGRSSVESLLSPSKLCPECLKIIVMGKNDEIKVLF